MHLFILVLIFAVKAFGQGSTFSFQVGDFQIVAINDLDGEATFKDFIIQGPFGPPVNSTYLIPELQRVGYQVNIEQSYFVAPIMCLYVQIGEIQFIIDTGLGPIISQNKSSLIPTLASLGVHLEEIDYVILTHGHPDHSGGLIHFDGSLLFPESTLIMGEEDWNLWTMPNPDWADFCCPQLLNALLPEVHKGLFQYNESVITISETTSGIIPGIFSDYDSECKGVTFLLSEGHTSNGHMTILLQSQGQNLYVLGDSYFTPLHLENLDFGCTHDHHRVECIQSRKKFATEFQQTDLLLAMHFAPPGLGRWDSQTNVFTYINSTSNLWA